MLDFLIYLIIFLIGFGIILTFNWPMWTIIILGAFVFLIVIFNIFFTIYGTKNIRKVERFLLKNKKEPLYHFTYTYAKGTKEEQLEVLERLINKYGKAYFHFYYRGLREELLGNYDKAFEYAESIDYEPYHTYLIAHLLINIGKLKEAELLIPSISKEFMREELLAKIAYKKELFDQYEIHKRKAIEASKGVQRFNLVHEFKKLT